MIWTVAGRQAGLSSTEKEKIVASKKTQTYVMVYDFRQADACKVLRALEL